MEGKEKYNRVVLATLSKLRYRRDRRRELPLSEFSTAISNAATRKTIKRVVPRPGTRRRCRFARGFSFEATKLRAACLLHFRVLTRVSRRESVSPKINPSPILAAAGARRASIYATLSAESETGSFPPPEYFIALPRLGSCIYMWTGRYRKRNAMYTVLPKYDARAREVLPRIALHLRVFGANCF